MIKTPISSQDLRRSLYVKAKAEPTWRFWGLYVHVCKMETLQEAYQMAKSNGGAPGSDGVTFRAIEESGVESFLKQIQDELVHDTYQPMPVRKKEIPKDGGTKVRVLSIPAIRDRVVQGALKLILEKVAQRVQDDKVMRLLNLILKSTGKIGVPQGGVVSPLLSNLYLNEVDKMLEKARATTRRGKFTHVQYARFADDMVILIDAHPRNDWIMTAVEKRLREELAKLRVEINEEKSRIVDLRKGGSFAFLDLSIALS